MATKTRAEMIDLVLSKLGALAAGQTASDEDGARAGSALDSMHNRLVRQKKASFALASTPDWAWEALSAIVAEELIPDFGVKGEQRANIMLAAKLGRETIIEEMREELHPGNANPDYF